MSIGITVLPARLTRLAPAGTFTSAALPACVIRGAVDHDRSVLDHAAVADDDPGALIGRLRMGGDGKSCEDTKGNCRDRGYVHSVHWKPPDIYSWTAIL